MDIKLLEMEGISTLIIDMINYSNYSNCRKKLLIFLKGFGPNVTLITLHLSRKRSVIQ